MHKTHASAAAHSIARVRAVVRASARTRRTRNGLGTISCLVSAMVLSACGGGSVPRLAGVQSTPEFEGQTFAGDVSNLHYPLIPGTELTYARAEGTSVETTTVRVTARKREVLGVSCAVVTETVRLDGVVIEESERWHVQDTQGNVWNMGVMERGPPGGSPQAEGESWEAGRAGARPGIAMFAYPVRGTTYPSEPRPAGEAEIATVSSLGATVLVPFGGVGPCIEITERLELESGGAERSYFAPGVGLVLEIDAEGRRLELVRVKFN